nr:hypothetical protein [Gemmatimonadota bacterium]
SEEGRAELGLGNWVAVTFVLLVISLFLFLAGYRKLPGCVGTDGERHLSVGDR